SLESGCPEIPAAFVSDPSQRLEMGSGSSQVEEGTAGNPCFGTAKANLNARHAHVQASWSTVSDLLSVVIDDLIKQHVRIRSRSNDLDVADGVFAPPQRTDRVHPFNTRKILEARDERQGNGRSASQCDSWTLCSER